MHILAVDVGEAWVQAAVLESETAKAVSKPARAEFAVDRPGPEAAEVPWERLWQALTQAARAATRHAPEVEAVGMAAFSPAVVLVDHSDRPCQPIWTPNDRRARPVARQIDAVVGEELLACTGQRPFPGAMTAVCLRQLLLQDPYLAHEIRNFLHVNGWLGLHMTGERAFDWGNAGCTGMFGTLTDQKWSPHWCDYFEVEPTWLPEVRSAKDTLGNLRSAVAAELGVPPGIPVKVGAADIDTTILALDMKPGDLLHVEGATQVLAVVVEAPKPDSRRFTRHLGIGDRFVYLTHNPLGSAALAWMKELCFREQSDEEFYTRTIVEARRRNTRVHLDPPFLAGDALAIEARRGAFRDLELSSDRLDLLAGLVRSLEYRHQEALAALDHIHSGAVGGAVGGQAPFSAPEDDSLMPNKVPDPFPPRGRVFFGGASAAWLRTLIPAYQSAEIQEFENGSLLGIAELFRD